MTTFDMHPVAASIWGQQIEDTSEQDAATYFDSRQAQILKEAYRARTIWADRGFQVDTWIDVPEELTVPVETVRFWLWTMLDWIENPGSVTPFLMETALLFAEDLRCVVLSAPEARAFWRYAEWAFPFDCPDVCVIPSPWYRNYLGEVVGGLLMRESGSDRFPEPYDLHVFVSDFARDAADSDRVVFRDEGVDALPWTIQAAYWDRPNPIVLFARADAMRRLIQSIWENRREFLVDLLEPLGNVISYRESFQAVRGKPWTFAERGPQYGPRIIPKEHRGIAPR